MSNSYKSGQEAQDSRTRDAMKSESKDSGTNPSISVSEKNSSGGDKIRNFSSSNKDKPDIGRDPQMHNQKSEFDSLQNKMEDFGENLKERGQYLSKQVSDRVRNNPWAFVGGASVAGLAIGYFMGRRRTA